MSRTSDTTSRARERRVWDDWRTKAPAIAERIRKGAFLEPACRRENVSFESVRDALDRFDEDADVIAHARADVEMKLNETSLALASAGESVASGPGYLLERIAPRRYHLPSRVEMSGPDGAPVQTQAVTLTLADAVSGARGKESE